MRAHQTLPMLIPPKGVLVAKGKDGKPRVLPLKLTAPKVFRLLLEGATTGEWLFTNRKDEPIKAIKKGFAAACVRAGIENLRPYDLRHTLATRLLERGIHHFVISALLGHATPMAGFGYASRMTPGYDHATWETMVEAVATLEKPLPGKEVDVANADDPARIEDIRKAS